MTKNRSKHKSKPTPHISRINLTPPHKCNPDSRIRQHYSPLIVSANCLQTLGQIKESSADVLLKPTIPFYPEALFHEAPSTVLCMILKFLLLLRKEACSIPIKYCRIDSIGRYAGGGHNSSNHCIEIFKPIKFNEMNAALNAAYIFRF